MLKQILSISGRPGLYRLVSQGKRNLIVEALDASHRRMPAFGSERITSLGDISMYTETEDVPLRKVMKSIHETWKGKPVDLDPSQASKEELSEFMAKALPAYDRDRVHASDVRRLIQWYNILVAEGITDFEEELAETEGDHV